MFLKKIKFILIITLFYQTPLFSKSAGFSDFNSINFSKYFSGIVASENKDNTEALEFFDSSRILIENYDPYLKKYLYSLVLENKVNKAINLVKSNRDRDNTNFFDAYLLLILADLKKGDFKKAYDQLNKLTNINNKDRFNSAILESLKQYSSRTWTAQKPFHWLYNRANGSTIEFSLSNDIFEGYFMFLIVS